MRRAGRAAIRRNSLPIADNDFFVQQQYIRFLTRMP
jgi:hypothetical protein